jgi:hypothetical protein
MLSLRESGLELDVQLSEDLQGRFQESALRKQQAEREERKTYRHPLDRKKLPRVLPTDHHPPLLILFPTGEERRRNGRVDLLVLVDFALEMDVDDDRLAGGQLLGVLDVVRELDGLRGGVGSARETEKRRKGKEKGGRTG